MNFRDNKDKPLVRPAKIFATFLSLGYVATLAYLWRMEKYHAYNTNEELARLRKQVDTLRTSLALMILVVMLAAFTGFIIGLECANEQHQQNPLIKRIFNL